MKIPKIDDIKSAYSRISGIVKKTPILISDEINRIFGCEIYFKCENFQKVGAFKFRGATNAVLSLSESEASKGVATHSSGNHAQALALAAKNLNIPATIIMPNNAPQIKIEGVKSYGAEIIFCEPNLRAREENLEKVIAEKGSTFIHPYNNFHVICGQGTATLEIFEEISDLEILMAPVGGGGLLSGTAIAGKSINQKIEVIAAEPKGADDANRSFYKGELVASESPNSICDGLLTSLGTLNFQIIKQYVDDIITADDSAIRKAMKLILEKMKIIIEPSSAVPLAVIMSNPKRFQDRKIGIILSGGNVDLKRIPELIQ